MVDDFPVIIKSTTQRKPAHWVKYKALFPFTSEEGEYYIALNYNNERDTTQVEGGGRWNSPRLVLTDRGHPPRYARDVFLGGAGKSV